MIQAQVYEKRVELRDHFRDFDQLRKGVVPACKLRCVLSLLNIEVTEAEVRSLTETYGNDDNMIDYLRLCSDIERDLICPDLETDPSGQPPPPFDLVLAKGGKKPTLSASETDVISRTEEMIRRTSRQRGINPLSQFRDFDRYNRLVITESQFKRTMKTLGFEISEPEYDIILKKYCIHGSPHRFSYREFCRSIESL
jgi:Ca2+-binding EF-hand superfamily protein